MWRRAAWAALGLLIGVMADKANIEVRGLGYVGLVKEAKIGVPNNIETRIQKTSLHKKSFLSVHKVLVDREAGTLALSYNY